MLLNSRLEGFTASVTNSGAAAAAGLTAAAVGGTAAIAGMAVAVAAIGYQGLQEFAALEQKIVEVETLLQDTTTSTEGLTDSIERMAYITGKQAEDLASAFYDIISATIPLNDAIVLTGEAAIGATAGLTSVQDAATGLTAAYNAFGLAGQTANDMFFKTVELGVLKLPNVTRAVGLFAGAASAANIPLQEMLGALTTLTVRGVPVEIAVVQINNAVKQLLKSASITGQTFRNLTGQSFQEFMAAGGTLREAITMIGDEAKRTGTNIFEMVPEVRAARGFQGLIDGADKWKTATDEIANSTGAADEAFNRLAATTQTGLERMGQWWDNTKRRIGETSAAFLEFLGIIPDAQTADELRMESLVEQAKAIIESDEARLEAAKELTLELDKQVELQRDGMSFARMGAGGGQMAQEGYEKMLAYNEEMEDFKDKARELYESIIELAPQMADEMGSFNDMIIKSDFNSKELTKNLKDAYDRAIDLRYAFTENSKWIQNAESRSTYLGKTLESVLTTTKDINVQWLDYIETQNEASLASGSMSNTLRVAGQNVDMINQGLFEMNKNINESNGNAQRLAENLGRAVYFVSRLRPTPLEDLDPSASYQRDIYGNVIDPYMTNVDVYNWRDNPKYQTTTGGGGGGGSTGPLPISALERARHRFQTGGSREDLLRFLTGHVGTVTDERDRMRLEVEIHNLTKQLEQTAKNEEESRIKLMYATKQITAQEYQNYLMAQRAMLEEGSADYLRLTQEIQNLDNTMNDAALEIANAAKELEETMKEQSERERMEFELTEKRAREEEWETYRNAIRREDLMFSLDMLTEGNYRRMLQARIDHFGWDDLGIGTAARQKLFQLDQQAAQDAQKTRREQLEELRKINEKLGRVRTEFDPGGGRNIALRQETLRYGFQRQVARQGKTR